MTYTYHKLLQPSQFREHGSALVIAFLQGNGGEPREKVNNPSGGAFLRES